MNDLKISLYDIFGYLAPGAIDLFALISIYRAIFHPPTPWIVCDLSVPAWIFLAFLAYTLGHVLHALANKWTWICPKDKAICIGPQPSPSSPLPEPLWQAAKGKTASLLRVKAEKLNNEVVAEIAHYVAPTAPGANAHELYVYREGFYRGMIFSFGLLAISLFVTVINRSTMIDCQGNQIIIPPVAIWVGGVLCLLFAVLARYRFKRFVRYRVGQALACLILSEGSGNSKREIE